MNREIKFRAWDKKTKEYFHISELWNSGTNPECFNFDGWTDNFGNKGRLKDIVIEQFTGLKDANGKEIYEGDVLEYYYETHGQTFYDPDTLGAVVGEPGIETNVIGKVAIWPSTGVVLTRIKAEYPEDFDSSNLDVPKMLHVNKHFTIIGNLHTNHELLEAEH